MSSIIEPLKLGSKSSIDLSWKTSPPAEVKFLTSLKSFHDFQIFSEAFENSIFNSIVLSDIVPFEAIPKRPCGLINVKSISCLIPFGLAPAVLMVCHSSIGSPSLSFPFKVIDKFSLTTSPL